MHFPTRAGECRAWFLVNFFFLRQAMDALSDPTALSAIIIRQLENAADARAAAGDVLRPIRSPRNLLHLSHCFRGLVASA
jgi:hypothetical protein